jgi:hypothetical protein
LDRTCAENLNYGTQLFSALLDAEKEGTAAMKPTPAQLTLLTRIKDGETSDGLGSSRDPSQGYRFDTK